MPEANHNNNIGNLGALSSQGVVLVHASEDPLKNGSPGDILEPCLACEVMSNALDALSNRLESERKDLEGKLNQGKEMPEVDGNGLTDVEKAERIEEQIRDLNSRMATTKRKDRIVALECRVERCETAIEKKKRDWLQVSEGGFPREVNHKAFVAGMKQLRAEIEKCKAEVTFLEGQGNGNTA